MCFYIYHYIGRSWPLRKRNDCQEEQVPISATRILFCKSLCTQLFVLRTRLFCSKLTVLILDDCCCIFISCSFLCVFVCLIVFPSFNSIIAKCNGWVDFPLFKINWLVFLFTCCIYLNPMLLMLLINRCLLSLIGINDVINWRSAPDLIAEIARKANKW